jgi:hypothetical protein
MCAAPQHCIRGDQQIGAEIPVVAIEEGLRVGPQAHGMRRLKPRFRHFAYYAILVFCTISALRLTIQEGAGLFSLKERGYGDGYILHTVEQYLKTGQLYPDLHGHDELPSQYSPLLYIMFSVPVRIGSWENSYVGPRLMVLASFLACLGLVASISRKLIGCRAAVPVSMLLAGSFGAFFQQKWPTQLRGDFPSICFALLAIRLLLEDRPWSCALAGAAAGFALQFKLTYVAAGTAGFLWLIYHRKWKSSIAFMMAAALTSLGVYVFMLVREPHMLEHILVLRSSVPDYSAVRQFLYQLGREPVLLLGVTMVPVLVFRRWLEWSPLALYFLISFALSTLLSIQAGANINYFFESLFAITPFAAAGMFWLREQINEVSSVFVALLIWSFGIHPAVVSTRETMRVARDAPAENRYLEQLRVEFAGKNVFSTVGWASHLTQNVAITEPYLLSLLERRAKWDSAPWVARIRQQRFDLVVADLPAASWRGIPHIPPKIRTAIEDTYEPFCACPGILLFHRRGENLDSVELERFVAIGCHAVVCPNPNMMECQAW